jgi:hypothetical protein
MDRLPGDIIEGVDRLGVAMVRHFWKRFKINMTWSVGQSNAYPTRAGITVSRWARCALPNLQLITFFVTPRPERDARFRVSLTLSVSMALGGDAV